MADAAQGLHVVWVQASYVITLPNYIVVVFVMELAWRTALKSEHLIILIKFVYGAVDIYALKITEHSAHILLVMLPDLF